VPWSTTDHFINSPVAFGTQAQLRKSKKVKKLVMADQDTSLLLAATGLLILGAAHFVGTKIRRTRRWKTRPIYASRWKNGFYRATFLPMKANDPDHFFKSH
jgi:hypothetical protein